MEEGMDAMEEDAAMEAISIFSNNLPERVLRMAPNEATSQPKVNPNRNRKKLKVETLTLPNTRKTHCKATVEAKKTTGHRGIPLQPGAHPFRGPGNFVFFPLGSRREGATSRPSEFSPSVSGWPLPCLREPCLIIIIREKDHSSSAREVPFPLEKCPPQAGAQILGRVRAPEPQRLFIF